jgi:cytochrome c-type biogenesis protein CcmF
MLMIDLGCFTLLIAFMLAILQVALPTVGIMRNQVAW